MKYVQFIDRATREAIDAAAVAAYSMRTRGKLPGAVEYILCTPAQEVEDDETARAVFDRIEPPPIDVVWFNARPWDDFPVPHRRYVSKRQRYMHRVLWQKFTSWTHTPCDGEPVIFADYDTIVFGSMAEIIPPEGKTWAARRNGRGTSCGQSTNGGLYVKTPEFETDGAPELMIEPLESVEKYREAAALWKYDDEMASAWYCTKYDGAEKLHAVDRKFNRWTKSHAASKKSIEEADVRMLHFIGDLKPWHEPQKPFVHMMRRWQEMREEMRREHGIRTDILRESEETTGKAGSLQE